MLQRLSYFDLMMYVLPGAVICLAVTAGWSAMGFGLPDLGGEGGLFGSVVFLMCAYIAGHAVQSWSNGPMNWFIKRGMPYGDWATATAFLPKAKVMSPSERLRCSQFLEREGLLETGSSGLLQALEEAGSEAQSTDPAAVRRASQAAFYQCRGVLRAAGQVENAEVAEARFQLHRGLAMAWIIAAAIGALVLGGLWGTGELHTWEQWTKVGLPALVGLPLAMTFGARARGASRGLAREVFRGTEATLVAARLGLIEKEGRNDGEEGN